ncbi:hypothetical protein DY000_02021618 [Brassica cretica]|uniref:Uncharacterized protein n=1 Tax=Brassica cretica TaxID=69181 RepID=A0ABQ7ECR6_BRACR|nr:hypothetical protein DY000_02021618 [Brassica cretica]
MPSSTRSNKETQLLFSPDPASLECSIRKETRSSSTDNNTCVSLDSAQPPSTQILVPSTDTRSPLSTDNTHLPSTNILHPTSIDTPSRITIDTEPRDMVAPLILVRDNNGDLHDQEGHLRNAAGVTSTKIHSTRNPTTTATTTTRIMEVPTTISHRRLNTKFETLSTHVKKLEMQVVQTGDVVKRQEASTRGVRDDVMKQHVNAIIEDDFWQVVKKEMLQEGDFEVESLMSFGGSQWCRSTPDLDHRSTYSSPNRSTGTPEHRSTTPTESTASCNAVKILTHEEFAAKHPHPPSPVNVRIDRHGNNNIDRHSEAAIDRQPPASID